MARLPDSCPMTGVRCIVAEHYAQAPSESDLSPLHPPTLDRRVLVREVVPGWQACYPRARSCVGRTRRQRRVAAQARETTRRSTHRSASGRPHARARAYAPCGADAT
jgi:hypothetical protein